MSETLKGNLSQLKLVDILKILCNSKRTGKLSLQSAEDSADIYLVTGEIIHAKHNTVGGIGAIFDVVSWSEGGFNFFPNISVKKRTITDSAAQILTQCERIDAEWAEIHEVIPHTNLVFKMSSGTPSEISLNATEWNILRHINGLESIRVIADKVELALLDVTKAFYKLFRAGLIEIVGEAVERRERKIGIDPALFGLIERELAQHIGPLAAIVLDDHIQALGEARDSFAKDKLPELVELLSSEIRDARKLIDFQKNMLEIIRNA